VGCTARGRRQRSPATATRRGSTSRSSSDWRAPATLAPRRRPRSGISRATDAGARGRIVELVNAQRQVAVYGQVELADAGGLMAYSFSVIGQSRSGAIFIDKILRGANPAELPVEQPTHFELNLETARAQGVTFPGTVLLRADRVIE